MVARRRRLMALAVGLSVSLLAEIAAGAETAPLQNAPAAAERAVDAQVFRTAIDVYIREQSRQMRETLNQELRRELPGKIVLSTNELRTKS